MARSHGRLTQITINADDLSAYTNASDLERGADSHDTTTYGASHHRHEGGLKDGTFKCSGFYEVGADGPHQTLAGIVGTVVEIIRKIEGTGSGKPLETWDALLVKYTESAPVADYVQWAAEFENNEYPVETTQGA